MIDRTKSLQQALADFDPARFDQDVELAARQREELRRRFPVDHWPEMALEEYALGQEDSEEAYCRWMEFRTCELCGIGGGSARKHVIYKKKREDGWYFPSQFGDEQEAWRALRAEFVRAFELAEGGEWAEIDELELLRSCSALCLKTLHVHFPDDVLPICSRAHLHHFLRLIGELERVGKQSRGVRSNRELLGALRRIPQLEGLATKQLERFLYTWADPNDGNRIVKIAPGEGAKYWDDCLQRGYICVGWDAVGDLSQFESKSEFRERFAEEFPYNGHKASITRKSNELWTLMQLEPGDLVVANKGTSRVLGVGEVVDPGYEWIDDRPEYKHCVKIRWDTSYAKEIAPQRDWATVTVKKVPEPLFESIVSGASEAPVRTRVAVPVDRLYRRIEGALERKGQLVLYGPPGTGKTYAARRFAIWWLLKKAGDERADSVLGDKKLKDQCERELLTSQARAKVWWAVASPEVWSWDRLAEEGRVTFAEGRLKRNFSKVQCGDLVVGYQSTPDKRIVALARVTGELQDRGEEKPSIELGHYRAIPNGPTYEELIDDPVLGQSEPLQHRCQGTMFSLTEVEAEHLFSSLLDRDPEFAIASEADGVEVRPLTRVTFHPSYTYEDFIEGFRPHKGAGGGLALRLDDGIFKRVCRAAKAHPKIPYLVLIDELNRGNVAKILGELLTLLERDKRGMSVLLPQSKEGFSIPENVYLLGTMNTADRSINLLDAALRRRFAFLELMPDLELLRGANVGDLALDEFLDVLNGRIAEREGREKQIGHSYLLVDGDPVAEPDDFAMCFREEILPLLQEYCYDEYGTLARFIGKRLVDEQTQTLDHELLDDPEQLVAVLAEEFGGNGEVGE